jgi:type IV pilus assembly protein PilE
MTQGQWVTKPKTAFAAPRNRGFTLVELMIACVVLAIIVSIAMPAYTLQVRKSRRADARNAILDLAGREERFLSVANSYSQVPSDMGYAAFPVLVNNGYYNLNVAVPDPAYVGNGPSYIITATPTGSQAGDTDCATFTVNQIGKQVALNSGGADDTATCWGL